MTLRIRPGGIGTLFDPDGRDVEVETSTCAHCQRITDIPSRRKLTEVVDVCRLCMRFICLQCADKPCTPHLKKIEMAEEAHYRRQQFMKMAGL